MDTHEVVAMVAPRGLFIMDNPDIANLGPRSGSVITSAWNVNRGALAPGQWTESGFQGTGTGTGLAPLHGPLIPPGGHQRPPMA